MGFFRDILRKPEISKEEMLSDDQKEFNRLLDEIAAFRNNLPEVKGMDTASPDTSRLNSLTDRAEELGRKLHILSEGEGLKVDRLDSYRF
ncbi:MAG: hypothetical protein COT91_01450 [Candidatus Doudnabacteria bacterium CG10_big_fil_rev_8_21_14_0_10_41_10]|uniref:Uncharacterized protein n=1 Tax=Candidatus Doudnabacteria bacterium CG10_big_fil_rev_8_21_14_0_10_41_10 TaxID=1974551 RepID=A0A2H0VEE6_9BACT|nr:MAG: hypothetical protein COT91_01450 [Candidatus Doudnabacteria bacterium CG10_big_fil_rev_8_21_14_0_10_41_10]